MQDPTHQSLEAAILDQKVAGAFHDVKYAYVPVMRATGKPWGVGIAVENQHGYTPLDGIDCVQYDKRKEAEDFCLGMNQHIGLTTLEAARIVVTSMRRQ
jgi:hypothetical protein